jgi:thiamine biosynthesis lipoprotein
MSAISPPRRLAEPFQPKWSRRAILSGSLTGRFDNRGTWIRISRRAMACAFEVILGSEDAGDVPSARAALDAVDAIEDELSIFRHSSAIADLNRRGGTEAVVVNRSLFDLLHECVEIHRATGGAFDITSTPLSRCWGFLQRDARLPSQSAIDSARAKVGLDALVLDEVTGTVRFSREGLELNLGAIGKGHALDRVGGGLRAAGVTHALLSAGRSSLLALGGRGRGWSIDLVSPVVETPLARVWLRDAALGTSGAGEQFVTVNGVRYGHVIDPRTGWPASGTLSATVIASTSAAADALSTAFLIGGVTMARRYCATRPNVMAVLTPESRITAVIGSHPGARVEVV